jgi:hypothetical protein
MSQRAEIPVNKELITISSIVNRKSKIINQTCSWQILVIDDEPPSNLITAYLSPENMKSHGYG